MAKKSPQQIELNVRLHEREPEKERPRLALYRIGAKGRPVEKVTAVEDDVLRIPGTLKEDAHALALGPDVEEPEALEASTMYRFRADLLERWQERGAIDLAPGIWEGWLELYTCVSGTAERCYLPWPPFPYPTPVFPLPGENLGPGDFQILPWPPKFCLPLCHGTVEVYRIRCCCDPWVIIPEIPELIPEGVFLDPSPDPPIPWPIPDPEPAPVPATRSTAGSCTVSGGVESADPVRDRAGRAFEREPAGRA